MSKTANVVIIGAGGVGAVTAHKCAQNNDRLGDIWLASRSLGKCEAIAAEVRSRGSMKVAGRFVTAQLDAKDIAATSELIARAGAGIVINVASPHVNLAVLEACMNTGAAYIDTAVYEKEGEMNMPPPWYANYEWKLKERCEKAGVSAILSCGFDPGAVNAFVAWVARHMFDDIDSIDIMDVNAGSHGRYFATNFDPETNLREILEDVVYWENGHWVTIPHHSKSMVYDFPEVGEHTVYSMGHDELHSLAGNVKANRIEFWMGFSAHYLKVFEVLENLGLLGNEPVNVEGVPVIPIKLVKALLPDPASLAEGYTGKVCIGCLVKGRKDGHEREVFIYSTKAHAECFADVGSQAISYTTGVPAVAAALAIAEGPWDVRRMVNVEELDPEPFLERMAELGMDWAVKDSWGHSPRPGRS